MRFMIRGLFGLFLAILTAALILAAVTIVISALKDDAAKNDRSKGLRERIFTVNVAKVTSVQATPVIETFGEVISGRTLELRAASNGTLVQVAKNFREGGVVHKGELLFQTDPATASANAQLSQAALEEAKAELSEATDAIGLASDELQAAMHQYALRQQVLKRQTSLRERGIGTETALETAALAASAAQQSTLVKRQALANAKARISRANFALSRSHINYNEATRILAETSIIAKFDGILSDVTGDLGALVNAGERLGRLIDPKALEVSFRISNIEFNHMIENDHPIGQAKVTVRFSSINKEIPATIDRISAAVGEGQTGRELYASLDADKITTVRPGDFVSVRLEEPILDNVAILPATAVSAAGKVLVLGNDNHLKKLDVEILRKQGDQIIVSIGSLSGQEVVLERAPQLGEGIKVEPRRIDTVLFLEKATGR